MTLVNHRWLQLLALLGASLALGACTRRDALKNGSWTGDDNRVRFEIVNGTIASFSFTAKGLMRDSHCEFRIDELEGEILKNGFLVKGSREFDYPERTRVGYTFEGNFDSDNSAHGRLAASQSGSLCGDMSFSWSAEKDSWVAQKEAERRAKEVNRQANGLKLIQAAHSGDRAEVNRLLALDVAVNWQEPGANVPSEAYQHLGFFVGATALTEAVQRDDYETAELLLKAGADPNLAGWLQAGSQAPVFTSALQLAQSRHNRKLMQLLRAFGPK